MVVLDFAMRPVMSQFRFHISVLSQMPETDESSPEKAPIS